MHMSPLGRKALQQREAVVLVAYQDSIGVWTIGTGHTSAAGFPHPVRGLKITAAEAEDILSRDLLRYESLVDRAIRGTKVSQNAYDALVSIAFNVESAVLPNSSIIRNIIAGNMKAAADAFLLYNKAGGKPSKGLTTRRAAERAQFLTPDRVSH